MLTYDAVLPCTNNTSLIVADGNLIVSSKKSSETFPISQIQSFTIKEPSAFTSGCVTFRTAQSATASINLGFGISTALGAEKTFYFQKSDVVAARKLRDCIANYGSRQSAPVTAQVPAGSGEANSTVEELRGLKALLDEGILTQEEFDAKKKQVLGL